MTTKITAYKCKDCEKEYPNRQANIFGSRHAMRKHLQVVHHHSHTSASAMRKKHTTMGQTCGCLTSHYDVIEVIS